MNEKVEKATLISNKPVVAQLYKFQLEHKSTFIHRHQIDDHTFDDHMVDTEFIYFDAATYKAYAYCPKHNEYFILQ